MGRLPSPDPTDLASVPLFSSLSSSDLTEMAAWFEAKEVAEGVRLVGEGATGYSFFVIGEGGAEVTAEGAEIASLGAGDFFGEGALLGAGRRTATVTTTAPSRVFVLFGNDFARLQARHPQVAAELRDAMRRRLERE